MTNEQYLYVSYLVVAAAGVGAAVVTALVLARPHRRATAAAAIKNLGTIARRVFPAWLVLAVLLGFMSVSYFDCGHGTYARIVEDRPHLITKTQEQTSRMFLCLAAALTAYGFVLVLLLWAGCLSSSARPFGGVTILRRKRR